MELISFSMFIPRQEQQILEDRLKKAKEERIGSTIILKGEPGIGKSTLVQNFFSSCDADTLTASGYCLDMDGSSRSYHPWKEAIIELDADAAALNQSLNKSGGKSKDDLKKIVKTVMDETGAEWMKAIPQVGQIAAAIFMTAKVLKEDEIDIDTGDVKELSFKDKLKKVTTECGGEWLEAIPIVGNLAKAAFLTKQSISKKTETVELKNQEDFFI